MIKKKYLIIIPARDGSTEVKNKNLKKINGIPLINFSIKTAIKIKLKKKDREICVTTNSLKIIKNCKKFKDIKLIKRPNQISKKFSRDLEYVNHTLNHFKKKKILFNNIMILRPTNPIRTVNMISKAMNLFKRKNADSLKTLYPTKKTPFKAWILKKNNMILNVAKCDVVDSHNAPRQILPKTFDQTATLDILRLNYNTKLKSYSGKNILGLIISKKESMDIDTKEDLKNFKKFLKK
ncbi:hypothetical protein IDH22_00815 [Pelagibacterales bacterium SAG-MED35]|nr:hypothetical protein [Pelagibacterales bacterium SAG-MED35]